MTRLRPGWLVALFAAAEMGDHHRRALRRVEPLLAAAGEADVRVAVPKPGERVDPTASVELDPWWRLADRSRNDKNDAGSA